jgi:HAE1 family hydrophobic/amphiphilic exporter-1
MEEIMETDSDILNIESQLEKNNIGFDIVIDRGKASLMGINLSHLSNKILAATRGIEIFEIEDKGEKIETFLKLSMNNSGDQNNFSPEDILNMKIRNNFGKYIFLSSFLEIIPKNKSSVLYRYNRKSSITITAEVKGTANLVEVVKKIKKEFSEKNTTKTNLEFGGAFAEQNKSFGETGLSFLIGIASIFGILIFLFNSIRLPLIIESVIPLAFSGVIIGL